MKTLEERFWSYVDRRGPDECWPWKGYCAKSGGHGRFLEVRRQTTAHRVSWEIHRGIIPEGMHVLHSCDSPSCVNPAHLFLGTQADNNRDMAAKGRQAKGTVLSRPGECNPNAKLTREIVQQIRAEYRPRAPGRGLPALAKKYGVGISAIHSIVKGHSWKESEPCA